MNDEEILKTEKHLIDFLMPIFFWMRLHFFRSSDFSQFAKKAISIRFHQKKICLNFAERINHLWLLQLHIHMCEKRPSCEKDWKVGKLFIVKLPVHFTVMESNVYHFWDDNQLIWAKKLFSEFVDKNCSMNDQGYSDLKGDTSRK